MHLHLAARDGLFALADGDVLELELVGGRLAGRDFDTGFLGFGHGPQTMGAFAE